LSCNTWLDVFRFGILRLALAALLVAAGLGLASRCSGEEALSLFSARGVTPEAVRQGTLGSCYFHATIAALARSHPDLLRNAILRNGQGSYRVHFYDGPEESVFPEDIDFGRAHHFDRSEGSWVLVLMRGYAQRALRQSLIDTIQKSTYIPFFARPMAVSLLNQSGPVLVAYDRAIRAVVNQDGSIDKAALKQKLAMQLATLGVPSAQAEMLSGFLDEKGFFDSLVLTVEQNGEAFGAYKSMSEGGIPMRVIEAFLGNSKAGLVADRSEFVDQLHRFNTGKMALVVGSWAQLPNARFKPEENGWFVASHSYTVMGFDEATQTVSLRNPWGTHPEPDGAFTLPLAVFMDAFESYSYSTPRP
jgi:hypothetical protein